MGEVIRLHNSGYAKIHCCRLKGKLWQNQLMTPRSLMAFWVQNWCAVARHPGTLVKRTAIWQVLPLAKELWQQIWPVDAVRPMPRGRLIKGMDGTMVRAHQHLGRCGGKNR